MKNAQNMLDLFDRSMPIQPKDVRVNDRIIIRWFTPKYVAEVDRSFHLRYDVVTAVDVLCDGGFKDEIGNVYTPTEGMDFHLVSRSGMEEPENIGDRVLIREDNGETYEAMKIYGNRWITDRDREGDGTQDWLDLAPFAIKQL